MSETRLSKFDETEMIANCKRLYKILITKIKVSVVMTKKVLKNHKDIILLKNLKILSISNKGMPTCIHIFNIEIYLHILLLIDYISIQTKS